MTEPSASEGNVQQLESVRYPIGPFEFDPDSTEEKRRRWIDDIRNTPIELRKVLARIPESRLDQSYREGGWSVRQVVHHLADSHMNIFIRFKLAITEDSPSVKPFDENTWAETIDGRTGAIEDSLHILDGLHARWALLLDSFQAQDFARTIAHPVNGPQTLDRLVQFQAWHGPHHVAQIATLA
jgi:uncharacterized damage-inducible protein DinB